MASDTASAAVPAPDDPAGQNQQAGLAGLLSAVGPARSDPAAFTLTPTTGDTPVMPGAAGPAMPGGGMSSATYHQDEYSTPESQQTGKAGSGAERSVIRAWLLAGAERWKKGADARLKQLDIKKAKAQAYKEARKVTVSRAEKIVGGSTSTGSSTQSNSGKSLDSKTKTSGNGGSGRAGSSGGAGKPGSGGGAAGRGTSGGNGSNGSAAGSGTKGNTGSTRTGGGAGKSGARSTSGGGSQGPKGSNGAKGTTGPQGSTGTSGGSGSRSGGPQSSSGSKGSSGSGGNSPSTGAKTTDSKSPNGNPSRVISPGSMSGKPWKPDTKTNRTGSRSTTADTSASGKTTDLKKAPSGTGPNTSSTQASKTPTATTPTGKGSGKQLKTKPSRETGYRDGSLAATTAAHVKAYGHGFRDGWTDTSQAAAREKKHLDTAHQQRKTAQQKGQTVTAPASSADYHQPQAASAQATPIEVKNVDSSHVELGAGADRQHISQGEVRRLKDFERKLDAKADAMTRIAEGSRALKAHADDQQKYITQLLEQAKTVEGGTHLIGALTKLEDAAKVQAGMAEEIERRAARAAEACKALLTNVETRYGSIYKAVVNSKLTAPAVLNYYRGMANA